MVDGKYWVMKKFLPILFWSYTFIIILSLVIPFHGLDFSHIKIEIGPIGIRMDYFLHILMFFAFYVIFWMMWRFNVLIFKTNPITKFLLLTTSVAVISEIMQIFIPGRSFYLLDLGSNLAGIFLGIVAIRFANVITKKSENN